MIQELPGLHGQALGLQIADHVKEEVAKQDVGDHQHRKHHPHCRTLA